MSAGVFLCISLGVQFSLRRKAASYVAACIYLRSKYLSEPDQKIELSKFAPSANGSRNVESVGCLPEIILTQASNMEGCCFSLRNVLEACVYGIVLLTTVLAVARLWFAYPS